MKTCMRIGCSNLHRNKLFCSHSCSNSGQPRKKVTPPKPCPVCGMLFKKTGRAKHKQYCSAACHNRYQIFTGLVHKCIGGCEKLVPDTLKVCSPLCGSRHANRAPRLGKERKSKQEHECVYTSCTNLTTNSKYCGRKCQGLASRKPIEYFMEQRERARQTKMPAKKIVHRRAVSADERKLMYDAQNGKCAIQTCIREARVIDHCHTTGKIRQMLCYPCNSAIGAFHDSITEVQAALEYLNLHGRDPAR